jgi:hydroxymethylbilane synthase
VNRRIITVGARGSLLSVAQTEGVIRLLKRRFPEYGFVLKRITTLGDTSKTWSRQDQGIFVKEIEEQLLSAEIDLAVHSIKDLPSQTPSGLSLSGITKRIDPRDLLVSRNGVDLCDIKTGALVGTSSLRRKAFIKICRPDLLVSDLRGNLDTRLRKLNEGQYDAIIVAAAGIKRLGIKGFKGKKIPVGRMLPACGQGALGIEVRSEDRQMVELARSINCPRTYARVSCEREFLRKIGGGCRLPIASFARILKGGICLSVMIASLDGKRVVSLKKTAPIKKYLVLARELAKQALDKGARQILEDIENA